MFSLSGEIEYLYQSLVNGCPGPQEQIPPILTNILSFTHPEMLHPIHPSIWKEQEATPFQSIKEHSLMITILNVTIIA